MTTDYGIVRIGRVGLLAAIGLVLLFRAFSYEDWALFGREVRASFDLRALAAVHGPRPARTQPQTDLSDIVRASPQPALDPRVRSTVPYPLPDGARLDRTVAGPNGSVVVFYGEPLPPPPERKRPFGFCATGYIPPPTHRWMVGTFDASRRQVWTVALERVRAVDAAFVQPDGGIVVWGRIDVRADGSPDTVLFRIGRGGIDPTFQDVRESQLAWQDPSLGRRPEITSVRMEDDGTLDVSGYFTSVRGVPRRHNVCLRADGSLAD